MFLHFYFPQLQLYVYNNNIVNLSDYNITCIFPHLFSRMHFIPPNIENKQHNFELLSFSYVNILPFEI